VSGIIIKFVSLIDNAFMPLQFPRTEGLCHVLNENLGVYKLPQTLKIPVQKNSMFLRIPSLYLLQLVMTVHNASTAIPEFRRTIVTYSVL
jgi:hypothetical protein